MSAVNPEHYRGEVECIDVMRQLMSQEEFEGFCRGCALKYVWRLGRKDAPGQDAAKAIWYLTWLTGRDPRVERS